MGIATYNAFAIPSSSYVVSGGMISELPVQDIIVTTTKPTSSTTLPQLTLFQSIISTH
jgi:hypothetical protein